MDNSDGSGFEISPRLSRSSRHVGGSYSSSTSANSRGKSRTTIRKTSSSNNGNNNHSDGLLHHGGKGNSFFGLTGFQSPRSLSYSSSPRTSKISGGKQRSMKRYTLAILLSTIFVSLLGLVPLLTSPQPKIGASKPSAGTISSDSHPHEAQGQQPPAAAAGEAAISTSRKTTPTPSTKSNSSGHYNINGNSFKTHAHNGGDGDGNIAGGGKNGDGGKVTVSTAAVDPVTISSAAINDAVPDAGARERTGQRSENVSALQSGLDQQQHQHFFGKEGGGSKMARPTGSARGELGSEESENGESPHLSPVNSAEEFLSDGKPRCYNDEGGEGRCLPTVFFFGVSKCGTTSLSNWIAEHPRVRFVDPPEGYTFREAHVFDYSPQTWHGTKSQDRRKLLAAKAAPEDIVIDYTPHYALTGEAPLRIADMYGEGPLKRNGLKFLVVLREPAGRTISSWEYKSEPLFVASTNATSKEAAKRLMQIEQRYLADAVLEGGERVGRLARCIEQAREMELFGREPEVTFCRTTKGKNQCEGEPPCEICNTHTEPWCNPRKYLEEFMYNAHVGKSAYAMQLQRWFNVFGRHNFKVVFTEDMAKDPVATLVEVLDFLGLDAIDPEGEKGLRSMSKWAEVVDARYNKADRSKKDFLAPQVTPELKESMRTLFAPYNKDLQDLLGVPLPPSWYVQKD